MLKLEDNPVLNSTIPGCFSDAYDISIDGDFEEAILSFEVPEEVWNRLDYVPSIYYYNEETLELEEVAGQYREGNRICAKLSHFSKYLLINKRLLESNIYPIEIIAPTDNIYANAALGLVFSLDESGSLSALNFSKMKNAAVSLVEELSDEDSVSVFTFDDTIRKHCSFTDKEEAAQVINDLPQHKGRTAIRDAALAAIDEFVANSPVDVTKILILLTDGRSNDDRTGLTYQQVAKKAADNNIIIYTIGVGNVSKAALDTLATGTKGQYYGIDDFNKLSQVFQQVLIDAEVFFDSDHDGISDYHEKKIAQNQMRLTTGAEMPDCALMDYLNPDSDGDLLEDGQEMEIVTNERGVFVRFYSSPFIPDTDKDGFDDYAEDLMGTSPIDEFDPYVSEAEKDIQFMAMQSNGGSVQTGDIGGDEGIYKGVGTVIPSNPASLKLPSLKAWLIMAKEMYYWGYIHKQVQKHIRDNNDGIKIEVEIAGGKRCDVIDRTRRRIWEVKPASYYFIPLKKLNGKQQLEQYIELINEVEGSKYFKGDSSLSSYKFDTPQKDYRVTYINAGDGMIYYSFEKIEKKPDHHNDNVISNDDFDDGSGEKEEPSDNVKSFPFTNKDRDDIAAMKRRMRELEPKVIVVESPTAGIIVDIGMLIFLCADDALPGIGQADDALVVKKIYDILRKGKVLLEFVLP